MITDGHRITIKDLAKNIYKKTLRYWFIEIFLKKMAKFTLVSTKSVLEYMEKQ